MNEFSAAICLEQLKKINKMISLRFQIAKMYHSKLKIENKMPLDKNCAYNFYWIFVKNPKEFIKIMNENNVEIGKYHDPIHTLNYYKSRKNLPNTEYIAKHHVLLPTHPNLSSEDVKKIIRLTNKLS
jgi:perosamine synthetase